MSQEEFFFALGSKNLIPPEMTLAFLDSMASMARRTLPPEFLSAIKALKEAYTTPDSLVRVTFMNREQVIPTLTYLMNLCRNYDLFDAEKNEASQLRTKAAGLPPLIELKNGSAVEFVLRQTSPDTDLGVSFEAKK